jgi:hypothetical protein
MPSSIAALEAFRASVTLSFFSPTSASLAPPICNSRNILRRMGKGAYTLVSEKFTNLEDSNTSR